MEKVKVVIPIYTTTLREEELLSLRRTAQVLGHYPVVIVTPWGLDAEAATSLFSSCETLRVGDEWLGIRNGVKGYNEMMMSKVFYDHFADTEYILICQPDAYIFRDELSEWCDKGYDYVGAPLPRKPRYDKLAIRLYHNLRRRMSRGVLPQDLLGRVLNGGLSLRRVEAFRKACDTYQAEAAKYRTNSHHLYNEDVFWSLVPREFVLPDERTAMHFAFDVKPEYCFNLLEEKLPFGCHGWFVKSRAAFWSRFIP